MIYILRVLPMSKHHILSLIMEKNTCNNYLRVRLILNHQNKARNGFSDPKNIRKSSLHNDLVNIFFIFNVRNGIE